MKQIKYLVNLLYLGGLFFIIPACDWAGTRGSGDFKTETRSVSNFHALEIDVPGEIEVRVDSVFKVEVTCEENIIDDLETIVDDGTLEISFDRRVYSVDDLKIIVYAPAWDAFELNGSGNIKVRDLITGTKLTLDISGSGNIDVPNAVFGQFDLRISGSGDIELDGEGDHLEATLDGSGDIDAVECPVKTAEADLTGSGNIRLYVTDTLDVEIDGSGNVEYKGEPQVTKNISGSGKIKKI